LSITNNITGSALPYIVKFATLFLNHSGRGAVAVWLFLVAARQRRGRFFDFTIAVR
jgi:hypothetical protein